MRYSRRYVYEVLVLFCCLATALGAWIRFYLGPVPFTLQNVGIALSGLLLPPSYAALAQLLYLALIGVGLPLSTQGGGIHVLFGYTAGYLWMFPVASALYSYLVRRYLRSRSLDRISRIDIVVLLMLSAVAIVPLYIVGTLVLYLYATLPRYQGLATWLTNVANQIFGLRSLGAACIVLGALVFYPQDVFMDHVLGIAIAISVTKLLKARGLLE